MRCRSLDPWRCAAEAAVNLDCGKLHSTSSSLARSCPFSFCAAGLDLNGFERGMQAFGPLGQAFRG